MKYAVTVLALLAATAGFSCPGLVGPASPEIRVLNASSRTMEGVTVAFPDDEVVYGTLAPGAASGYRAVERAYRYAYVRTTVDGDTMVLQPIDYVGETLLEPGRYTYRLDLADTDGPWLTLELVVD